ncbi:MAG: hypothetical protein ABI718_10975 [Acidobacteriota bacterium]
MDHAVSLVQAYLQLNGYFTSAEYPIMQSAGKGSFRTVTDIDILAFRFPGAVGDNGLAVHDGGPSDKGAGAPFVSNEPDEGLEVPLHQIDMIIGEVKEGRVNINSGARAPEVLRAVLRRFGTGHDDAGALVDGLLSTGSVTVPSGYQIRLIAFGAFPPGEEVPPCRIISLGHVVRFLQGYVRDNWDMLRRCQVKDPALGFLMTMEKARRGGAGRRGKHGVEIVSKLQPADPPLTRSERRRRPASADPGEAAPATTRSVPAIAAGPKPVRPLARQRPARPRKL